MRTSLYVTHHGSKDIFRSFLRNIYNFGFWLAFSQFAPLFLITRYSGTYYIWLFPW